MPTTNLKNTTIKKLQDKNFNDYYLVVNNDNQDEVYFCFSGTVKSGWDNLVSNYENIKEVEVEFEENERGKKVIGVYTSDESEIFV